MLNRDDMTAAYPPVGIGNKWLCGLVEDSGRWIRPKGFIPLSNFSASLSRTGSLEKGLLPRI